MTSSVALSIGACEAQRGVRRIECKNNGVFHIACDEREPCPAVLIRSGAERWPLHDWLCIAVDVTNPGSEPLLVECRPNGLAGVTVGGGQVIAPGKTRAVRACIPRDEHPAYLDAKLFGMFALPGHPSLVQVWSGLHPGNIDSIGLALIRPPAGAGFIIQNLRAEGSFAFLTEAELESGFFPFIDAFGQYRHRDWPGKTRSVEELRRSDGEEQADLAAHPAPSEWNRFGGWLGGPQLEPTGHFRTEKFNGKWWLVDPEGRLFWAHGLSISGLVIDGGTPIDEREHFFADLPDRQQFAGYYGCGDWFPVGYYKNRTAVTMFKVHAWNLRTKFGDNWPGSSVRRAGARLAGWGMNSFSSFSADTACAIAGKPCAVVANTRDARRIEGSEGYWGKFPDPFDTSFVPALESSLEKVARLAGDPFCIGLFVDNEMDWGDGWNLGRSLLCSGADQPAKQTARSWLERKYGSLGALNAAWRTKYDSWEAWLSAANVPPGVEGDTAELSILVARQYFEQVKRTLDRVAPNKLYLGCRFANHYYPDENLSCDWAVKLAAEFCDVVSFNRYRYSAADLRPAGADVPVFIGEWHMGALDRGLFHYTLRFAENQENRAELYRHYLESCLRNPYVVGAHWFQYSDEPASGRFDGENFQTGFIDICDRPYPEMVAASREMGRRLYEFRS